MILYPWTPWQPASSAVTPACFPITIDPVHTAYGPYFVDRKTRKPSPTKRLRTLNEYRSSLCAGKKCLRGYRLSGRVCSGNDGGGALIAGPLA